MTTAAIASSSYDTPAWGSAELVLAVRINPPSPASRPAMTYTEAVTGFVEMPAVRALFTLPPTARCSVRRYDSTQNGEKRISELGRDARQGAFAEIQKLSVRFDRQPPV
jgi:hypothetical protein